jgi:cation/acetate symporter
MYSVGWLVAYITVLLVIAEPCRNIGKYTLADILAYRNNPTRDAHRRRALGHHRVDVLPDRADGRRRRAGEDADRHRLRDLGDRVGVLMLAYVLFGGMVATTWVQIIKAVLLVTASIVLVMLVWMPYGFVCRRFLQTSSAIRRCRRGRALLGDPRAT